MINIFEPGLHGWQVSVSSFGFGKVIVILGSQTLTYCDLEFPQVAVILYKPVAFPLKFILAELLSLTVVSK